MPTLYQEVFTKVFLLGIQAEHILHFPAVRYVYMSKLGNGTQVVAMKLLAQPATISLFSCLFTDGEKPARDSEAQDNAGATR